MSWRKNPPCFCMHANEPVLCLGPLRAVAAYNYRLRTQRAERASEGPVFSVRENTPCHNRDARSSPQSPRTLTGNKLSLLVTPSVTLLPQCVSTADLHEVIVASCHAERTTICSGHREGGIIYGKILQILKTESALRFHGTRPSSCHPRASQCGFFLSGRRYRPAQTRTPSPDLLNTPCERS